MKYLLLLLIIIIAALGIKKIYAHQIAQNSCFENINNEVFKTEMMATEQTIILAVRTKKEYQGGNIQGAINIDVLEDNFEAKVQELDQDKTLLVYCRSGGRSVKASLILCNLGFKKVYNLSNGYMGWK